MNETIHLSDAGLTVLAQTVSSNEDGRLLWDAFMPPLDVDSTKIEQLTQIDFRPASDRRPWNTRGRRIPLIVPKKQTMEIEPIESNFRIDEHEMNGLIARLFGKFRWIQSTLADDIESRTITLSQSNWRRVELDVLQAWSEGLVTVRNPENNAAYDVVFDLEEGRIQEAGTPWTGVGINAYNEFVAWLHDARELVGQLAGVVIREDLKKLIKSFAPTLNDGTQLTLPQVCERIGDEIGIENFNFYPIDDWVDVFVDGGTQTQRVQRWPLSRIAALPLDHQVGRTAFAPVGRAIELDKYVPEAEINIRGNCVFAEESSNGRNLEVECQINPFPLLTESRIAVMDTRAGF